MWTTVECAGHPRDMGLAQGAAARTAIRAELERTDLRVKRSSMPSLRGLASGPFRGSGAGREFYRHFAHQAERLEGLATTADVPVDSILNLHLRVRAGGSVGGLLSQRASVRARTVGHDGAEKRALLERTLPQPTAGEAGWILRESRPAVGFRSVEVTLPWMVSAVAGVNEGGLAVVAGPLLWGAPGRDGGSPSLLLVQECLQRFGDVSGALDWCAKRPVEGEQSFVLADASGMTATVVVSGRERRIQEGEGELYLEGGELPGDVRSEGDPRVDAAEPAEAAPVSKGQPDRVWLDPEARRLQIDAAGISIDLGLMD
ncbi:MAG TPA: hypothetical protein EYQ60_09570 [Myxococcales bacterium]|nr:hypothetical protein [Myxococcales bacterium]HIK86414.1 hypothetical protein [Myxococcales bacterium]